MMVPPTHVSVAFPVRSRFGCVMAATVLANPQQTTEAERQGYLADVFYRSDNALREQSREDRPLRTDQVNNFERLALTPRGTRAVHRHGWGIASVQPNPNPFEQTDASVAVNPFESNASAERQASEIRVVRSARQAAVDPAFTKAVTQAVEDRSAVVLGHQRYATVGQTGDVRNNHPFLFEYQGHQLTGACNGTWLAAVEGAHQLKSRHLAPQGGTDSEAALALIAEQLIADYGTLSSAEMSQSPVLRRQGVDATTAYLTSCAKVLDRLNTAAFSQKNALQFRPVKQEAWRIGGEVQMAPSKNFILTDGRLLVAYREGHSLYLGVRVKPKLPEPLERLVHLAQLLIPALDIPLPQSQEVLGYTVATETQPDEHTYWFSIPEQHFVVLAPNEQTGQYQAEYRPLARVRQGPKAPLQPSVQPATKRQLASVL